MGTIIFSVIFLLGWYGVYWTSGREFNRRNHAGVEEFSSYNHALFWGLVEGLVRILSILAIGLGFACALISYVSGH